MSDANLFTPLPPDPLPNPDGYSVLSQNLSTLVGAREIVVKVMEIEPGNHLCPYHYEYVEEWLLVLAGPVQVRTPEGTVELADGAVMCFARGPDGAHQVSSLPGATRPARVVMFSADADPAVCVYPDSDKLAVLTHSGEDEVFVRRAEPSSHLDYWDGEVPPAPSDGRLS